MSRFVNRSQLAEYLGCSLTTIDQWVREGMPYVSRPARRGGGGWQFDMGQILEWHRTRERQNALGEVAKIDEGEAKRRKLAAEAALAELDLAERQGAVVAVADFETAWAAMIGAARAKLRGLGSKLGRVVALNSDPAECEALIDGSVDEALQELSEFEPVQLESEGAEV